VGCPFPQRRRRTAERGKETGQEEGKEKKFFSSVKIIFPLAYGKKSVIILLVSKGQ
jgi:hypothetical protein